MVVWGAGAFHVELAEWKDFPPRAEMVAQRLKKAGAFKVFKQLRTILARGGVKVPYERALVHFQPGEEASWPRLDVEIARVASGILRERGLEWRVIPWVEVCGNRRAVTSAAKWWVVVDVGGYRMGDVLEYRPELPE